MRYCKSNGQAEVIAVNLQHRQEQELEGQLTLDVVALAEKLQEVTCFLFACIPSLGGKSWPI